MKKSFLFTSVFLLFIMSDILAYKDQIFSTDGVFFPDVKQRSVLKGQIDNQSGFKNIPFTVELEITDITVGARFSYITYINDDGSFLFDIPLFHAINTSLTVCNTLFRIYLFPNDSLKIYLGLKEEDGYARISSAHFDNEHDNFQKLFDTTDSFINFQKLPYFISHIPENLHPSEIKDLYVKFEKEMLAIIDDIVADDSSKPKKMLLKDYMIYSTLYYLNRYYIISGFNLKDKQDRKIYYEYLTDQFAYNEKALLTSQYHDFLNVYRKNVEMLRDKNPDTLMYDWKHDTTDRLIQEHIRKSTDIIFNRGNGLWGEFAAASMLYSLLKSDNLNLNSIAYLKQLVSDKFTSEYIHQLLTNYCREKEKIIKLADTVAMPLNVTLINKPTLTGSELWHEIVDTNKGNVIHIIFLNEFINSYPSVCIQNLYKLQAKYKDQVKFVFVSGTISEEYEWKKIISTYQLEGLHYLLTNKQRMWMNGFINISSNMLVSKSGTIVNVNMSGIGCPEYSYTIDKLLAE